MTILIARVVTKKLAKIWVYARENRAARLLTRASNHNAAWSPGLQGKTVGTRLTKRRRQRELQFVVTFSMRGRGTTPKEGKGFRFMGGGMETPPHSSLAHAHAPTIPSLSLSNACHEASLYLNLLVHQNLKIHFFAVRASTTRLRCETYSTFDFFSFWTIDNPHGLHLL